MEWVLKLEHRNGWGEVETIEVGRLERRVVGATAGELGLTLAESKHLRPKSSNMSPALGFAGVGWGAAAGANKHTDPSQALGDPSRKPPTDFLSLGGLGQAVFDVRRRGEGRRGSAPRRRGENR
jgi:hypothetical protein